MSEKNSACEAQPCYKNDTIRFFLQKESGLRDYLKSVKQSFGKCLTARHNTPTPRHNAVAEVTN